MSSSTLRIDTLWVVVLFAAASFGLAVLTVQMMFVRKLLPAAASSIVMVAVVVLMLAATINSYFHYFPTLGSLFGSSATDGASIASVDALLRQHRVPSRGKVVTVDIPATVSRFRARPAQVYLPPAYFAANHPTLPVIMLLHGTPGMPSDWTRAAYVDVTADRYAAAHSGFGPIIVMPDPNGSWLGDTECVDGAAGNAETYLDTDVRRFMITRFGASVDRRYWAVGGSSEGGFCSVELALRRPYLFSAFLDFGGGVRPTWGRRTLALFGGSPQRYLDHVPSRLLQLHSRLVWSGLAAWMEYGSTDAGRGDGARLAQAMRARGMNVRFVVDPGGMHTFDVWTLAFEHALPWAMQRLGTVRPVPVSRSSASAPSTAPSAFPGR